MDSYPRALRLADWAQSQWDMHAGEDSNPDAVLYKHIAQQLRTLHTIQGKRQRRDKEERAQERRIRRDRRDLRSALSRLVRAADATDSPIEAAQALRIAKDILKATEQIEEEDTE